MKRTIRYKFGQLLIYGFVTWLQKVEGITSIVPNKPNKHYVLMDFDETNLFQVQQDLRYAIAEYGLNNVVIMSDKPTSFRVFSNTMVSFETLIKILLDTKGIDFNFIKWTMRREYATIRISKKKGRNDMKILNIINHDGKYKPTIDMFKLIEYQTDI
jgi:hypothetical protein